MSVKSKTAKEQVNGSGLFEFLSSKNGVVKRTGKNTFVFNGFFAGDENDLTLDELLSKFPNLR